MTGKPMTPTKSNPVEPKEWAEFQANGMLFLANTVLHFFGWAIVFEIENGNITNVYAESLLKEAKS